MFVEIRVQVHFYDDEVSHGKLFKINDNITKKKKWKAP